jgi:hypothetical protein
VSTTLRVAALLLLLAGGVAERGHLLSAPGVALALGLCLSAYLWFLAIARRPIRPTPRRRA